MDAGKKALFLKWAAKMVLPAFMLMVCLMPFSARAYHPMSTDDPGTTEFRHFEVEQDADLIVEHGKADVAPGYTLFHVGAAPNLELMFFATYNYWSDNDYDLREGWSDSKVTVKYRFLGDGNGPFNLGAEMNFTLPCGDFSKGLSVGDTIISNAILFGSVGKDKFRVLLNVGSTFAPNYRTSYLAGVALEYSPTVKLALVGEVWGYSDFNQDDDLRVEWLETLAGFYWSPKEWFNLSAGDSFGLMGDAPQNRLTVAVHFLW
jgi:hypothetical protein